MDLWIRSQDKTNLIKIEHLAITSNNVITGMSTNWDYDLGKYKTKERALEVLDEIQELLVPKLHHVCDRDLEGNEVKVLGLDYIQSIVYEMPEE